FPVRVEQCFEVDVVKLVAVERVQRSGLLAVLRCVAQAAAAAERLRLGDRDDLGTESGQLRAEQPVLPARAADDHAVDARADELGDLVLGQRMAGDRDERLRLSARGIAHAGGLPAGEDDRLHYRGTLGSGSAVSGRDSNAELDRPIPSYAKPAARVSPGS